MVACRRSKVAFVLPAATAADWPTVHARPLQAWVPALLHVSERLGLPDAWTRLPGGEDSAVFAVAEHVLKLVPPCNAPDAVREIDVLPRLDLGVPSPRLHAVLPIDGWTALHMSRLPGRPANELWGHLEEPARLALMSELGALLARIRRVPLTPDDGDASKVLAHLRLRAKRHEVAGFPDVDGFLDRHLRPDEPAFVHFDLHSGNVMLDEHGHLVGVLDFVISRAFYPALDLIAPGVFFAAGHPARLAALVEAARLQATPEELAAWHVLHPFSDLERDLRMAGRSGVSVEAVVNLWRS
jgi:aminoglycoside phosphotransferase (APT) family kinase protein